MNTDGSEQWRKLADAFERSADWLDKGVLTGSRRTHPLVGRMDYRLACDGLRMLAAHIESESSCGPPGPVTACGGHQPGQATPGAPGGAEGLVSACGAHQARFQDGAHDAKDAARFDWFFGPTDKTDLVMVYLKGVQEKWTPDQWRSAIDAAMSTQQAKESGNA